MDKISGIVRGNSRVASTDVKSTSAVRPGAPSYGGPVGESGSRQELVGTTASRAVALHNELMDNRRTAKNDQVVTQLADQFFMTKIKRPMEEQIEMPKISTAKLKELELSSPDEAPIEVAESEVSEDDSNIAVPVGFKPRGSYIDTHA